MPDPVIIDDGGSTRMKKIGKTAGSAPNDLDDIMVVVTLPASPKPYGGCPGSQVQIKARGGSNHYSQMRITYLDSDGSAFTDTRPIASNFHIVSGRFKVMGELLPVGGHTDLVLTVYSDAGSEPFIDARQHGQQRRYIVSNAPPIDQIFLDTLPSPGSALYDANAPTLGIPGGATGPNLPVVYSSVTII